MGCTLQQDEAAMTKEVLIIHTIYNLSREYNILTESICKRKEASGIKVYLTEKEA
jgi:hypothetical protein